MWKSIFEPFRRRMSFLNEVLFATHGFVRIFGGVIVVGLPAYIQFVECLPGGVLEQAYLWSAMLGTVCLVPLPTWTLLYSMPRKILGSVAAVACGCSLAALLRELSLPVSSDLYLAAHEGVSAGLFFLVLAEVWVVRRVSRTVKFVT